MQATEAGEYQKAIELFNQLAPTSKDPAVFCNRGNNYSYLGDLDAALADYATALELEHRLGRGRKTRRLASLHYNRGVAYRRNGQPALAIPCYERAIDVKASYPDACGNLARILATCSVAKLRDLPRAIRLAKQELSRRPEHDHTLDTLAAAYAADGQFQEAQEVQHAALKFAPPERLAEYQDRLFLYSIGQSYVEPLEDAQDTPIQSISGE